MSAPVLLQFAEEGEAEKQKLIDENQDLEVRILKLLAQKSIHAKLQQFQERGQQVESEITVKYQQSLTELDQCRIELSTLQSRVDQDAMLLKASLDKAEQEAATVAAAFTELRQGILAAAETRAGQKLSTAERQQMEEHYQGLQDRVNAQRLRSISLRHKLGALTAQLRKKEALSDRLHVIDFEQLKIENQTLAENIEQRAEELLKLRRKTVDTVQILAHVREKKQCVQSQSQRLKRELVLLDEEVTDKRDQLASLKHQRGQVRRQIAEARKQTGLGGNPQLVDDYADRKERVDCLKDEIGRLRRYHRELENLQMQ